MVVRTLLAIIVGLSAMLLANVAIAAPNVRLDYSEGTGVAGCPPENRLREAVVARLGEDPFDPRAARSFRVEITATSAGLEGRVTLIDEARKIEGARRFEGDAEHCAELTAAMALAISLAINPDLAVQEDAPALAGENEELAAVSPPPPPAPAVPEAAPSPIRSAPSIPLQERETSPYGFAIGAGVNGALGAGPSPALGALGFGRVRRGNASLAVEARFDAPFDHAVGAASVHTSLWAGAVTPCLHFVFLRGCWVALAGNVAAGSRGVSEQREPNGFFVATGPRAGVEWPLVASLSLSAQLEGLMTVKPVRIVLDGRQVWRTPPLSAAVGLAAVWRIP